MNLFQVAAWFFLGSFYCFVSCSNKAADLEISAHAGLLQDLQMEASENGTFSCPKEMQKSIVLSAYTFINTFPGFGTLNEAVRWFKLFPGPTMLSLQNILLEGSLSDVKMSELVAVFGSDVPENLLDAAEDYLMKVKIIKDLDTEDL